MINLDEGKNIVFVADVHLKAGDARGEKDVLGFLEKVKHLNAGELFILGDFFHLWINEPHFIKKSYQCILDKFTDLHRCGIKITYMVGNRDFLIANHYNPGSDVQVYETPQLYRLGNTTLYISHGDELCSLDRHYQIYKAFIRSSFMRLIVRLISGRATMAIANLISKVSKRCLERKSQVSVEVPMEEIHKLLVQGIDVVIHGHCHRSYKLEPEVGGRNRQVYCIGDWSKGIRFLFYDAKNKIFGLR